MQTTTRTDIRSTIPPEFETAEFSVAVNAQTFHVLLDSLYTNKVRAVVRELWTNAADSHVEAGVPDAPFECQLPTTLDPNFRVRDYGVSLSHDDVLHLYTTVFASTKTHTNDLVGCLGLGSKSPFAYTDAFQVTAWLDGSKRLYLCALDAGGTPTITHVSTEPSDEAQGFEVSFPVQRHHHAEFQREAAHVARGFKVLPVFVGVPIEVIQPVLTGSFWSVYETSEYAVRQGCVIYPVTYGQIPALPRPLRGNHGVVVDVPIGTVQIAASREALSLDDDTRDRVADLFNDAHTEIQEASLADVRNAPTLLSAEKAWSKANKLIALSKVYYHGGPDDPHSIQLSGRINFNFKDKASVPTFWNHTGRKTESPNFPVEFIDNTIIVVHRTGKTVRSAQRLKAWKDSLAYDGTRRIFVLKDPTPRQLRYVVRALELRPDQIVPVGSLPDVPPPVRAPRAPREARTGPSPAGAWGYNGVGDQLHPLGSIPDEYYWVPIEGANRRRFPLGLLDNDRYPADRDDALHLIASLTSYLGLERPVIFLTPTAQARIKPDPADQLDVNVLAAIAEQRADLLYAVGVEAAYESLRRSNGPLTYDTLPLIVEPIAGDGDLSKVRDVPNSVRNFLDPHEWREAHDEGEALADRVRAEYPIFFPRYNSLDKQVIVEYLTLRSQ